MKGILKNWHRYLLWLTVSFFFWAWIFTLITDAPAAKKLVLYADCPAMERQALDDALEADMPDSVRFVEARVFSDEMFQPSNLAAGDILIFAEEQLEQYFGTFTFAPLDRAAFSGRTLLERDGTAYGICVYDEAESIAAGAKYLAYLPGKRYFLFFNAASQHLGDWNGSRDDGALRAAGTFLTLP
jgi:hypothetical protein